MFKRDRSNYGHIDEDPPTKAVPTLLIRLCRCSAPMLSREPLPNLLSRSMVLTFGLDRTALRLA